MISINRSFEGNLYSQWGEEAAVCQLLRLRASLSSKRDSSTDAEILVEFGGSRGFDNSNFYRFMDSGYEVVMIEGDSRRFAELKLLSEQEPLLTAIETYVDGNNNSLYNILDRNCIKVERVAGVSIDIDGDDAFILENLGIKPDFVIVEYNPTLPLDGRYRNPQGANIGNSLGELLTVGHAMGMFPVCLTESNLILLNRKFANAVEELNLYEQIQNLRLTRFGLGYDGTLIRYVTSGEDTTAEVYHNTWNHSVVMQPLPKFLRSFGRRGLLVVLRYLYVICGNALLRPFSFFIFAAELASKKFRLMRTLGFSWRAREDSNFQPSDP